MVGKTGGLVIGIIFAVLGIALIVVLAIVSPGGIGLEDTMYWWASLIFGIGIAFCGIAFIFAAIVKPEVLENVFKKRPNKYEDIVDMETEDSMRPISNVKEPKKLKKKTYDTVI